ncbi:hypothetical protein DEO72_LG4g801 [Vigna unguiculata]|uniref:Uncharacterized protein n=1 Tax=Vigna unguiculata TaxID=3917 RepID=A0A4D6LMT8_VIGUN|nr:hypothetical protein DEO72_LG4g801 [Vigna unguiculata]
MTHRGGQSIWTHPYWPQPAHSHRHTHQPKPQLKVPRVHPLSRATTRGNSPLLSRIHQPKRASRTTTAVPPRGGQKRGEDGRDLMEEDGGAVAWCGGEKMEVFWLLFVVAGRGAAMVREGCGNGSCYFRRVAVVAGEEMAAAAAMGQKRGEDGRDLMEEDSGAVAWCGFRRSVAGGAEACLADGEKMEVFWLLFVVAGRGAAMVREGCGNGSGYFRRVAVVAGEEMAAAAAMAGGREIRVRVSCVRGRR